MAVIGVSVPVPDPAGRVLQDYRVGLGEAGAERIPTHVTLVPPTELHDDDLSAVCDHLAQVASDHPRFEVRLRGTGTFRPVSPVVFVNVVAGISACELLADDVRRGPLAADLDFPYHPHVTVAHQDDPTCLDRAFDELTDFESTFEVASFWLYVYGERAGWVPQHQFMLGTPEP